MGKVPNLAIFCDWKLCTLRTPNAKFGTIMSKDVKENIKIPNIVRYSFMRAIRKCGALSICHQIYLNMNELINIKNIFWD